MQKSKIDKILSDLEHCFEVKLFFMRGKFSGIFMRRKDDRYYLRIANSHTLRAISPWKRKTLSEIEEALSSAAEEEFITVIRDIAT